MLPRGKSSELCKNRFYSALCLLNPPEEPIFPTSAEYPGRNNGLEIEPQQNTIAASELLDLTQVPIQCHRQKTMVCDALHFPTCSALSDHDIAIHVDCGQHIGTSRTRKGLESSLQESLVSKSHWPEFKIMYNNVQ